MSGRSNKVAREAVIQPVSGERASEGATGVALMSWCDSTSSGDVAEVNIRCGSNNRYYLVWSFQLQEHLISWQKKV